MDGRATLTIVKSSTTMNWAMAKVRSRTVPPPAVPGGAAPGWFPGGEPRGAPALGASPFPASSPGLFTNGQRCYFRLELAGDGTGRQWSRLRSRPQRTQDPLNGQRVAQADNDLDRPRPTRDPNEEDQCAEHIRRVDKALERAEA